MATFSATDAKQRFSELLEAAQREPVRIQKHERDVAVLISAQEYERLRALRVAELVRLTEEIGSYATSQGMNDAVLATLLTEK